jgi:hypothetical protein
VELRLHNQHNLRLAVSSVEPNLHLNQVQVVCLEVKHNKLHYKLNLLVEEDYSAEHKVHKLSQLEGTYLVVELRLNQQVEAYLVVLNKPNHLVNLKLDKLNLLLYLEANNRLHPSSVVVQLKLRAQFLAGN